MELILELIMILKQDGGDEEGGEEDMDPVEDDQQDRKEKHENSANHSSRIGQFRNGDEVEEGEEFEGEGEEVENQDEEEDQEQQNYNQKVGIQGLSSQRESVNEKGHHNNGYSSQREEIISESQVEEEKSDYKENRSCPEIQGDISGSEHERK